MTRKATAIVLGGQALVLAALFTVALDLWAHKRVEELGGVSIWGYRGKVLPQKADNEIRIGLLGGDFAFGWGQAAGGTIAGALRQQVMLQTDVPGRPLHPVTAVNLAARGLTPDEYAGWLEHFAYLAIDVVCILPDPRNATTDAGELVVPDRRSAFFKLFGYAPILPLFLIEKGEQMQSGMVAGAGRAAVAIDRALASMLPDPPAAALHSQTAYLNAIERAIGAARHMGASVTVIAPPALTLDDASDVSALAGLADRLRASPVRYVALGASVTPAHLHHGFNLTSDGTARAAEAIAPAVISQVRAIIE